MKIREEFKYIQNRLKEIPELSPPFIINDNIFIDLEKRTSLYLEFIKKLPSSNKHSLSYELKKNIRSIDTLSKRLIKTLHHYLSGEIKEAYSSFDYGITKTKIHEHLNNITVPLSSICNNNNPLYRVRKSDNPLRNRQEMFHIPFNLRHMVNAQRYSISGLPCLYLGTSILVCWQEMEKPDFDKLYVSSFIKEEDSEDMHILNLAYNLNSIMRTKNSLIEFFYSQQDEDKYRKEKISNLIIWPLVLACNYLKSNKNASFNAEYIIPNLLMQWISCSKNNNISGIAYRTTKLLNQRDSDIGINVIIPPIMSNIAILKDNYCPTLRKKFKLTKPVSWQVFRTLQIESKESPEDNFKYNINTLQPCSGAVDNFDESLVENYNKTEFKKVENLINALMKFDYIEE